MVGYFNSYGARFRLNCFTNTIDAIDAAKHVSSPADQDPRPSAKDA
jgi:hypothetical protein